MALFSRYLSLQLYNIGLLLFNSRYLNYHYHLTKISNSSYHLY